ncbi:hypothetical protein H0H93_011680 [Arthromyces matolae]|nr:hypothetical protein H0H93_011680 [Arthromyces matolae]
MSLPTEKVRSTRLAFKGDKHKKKRKREDGESGSSKKSRRKDDDEDPETWVLPENANEIRGPTFIVHPSDPSPTSINFNSTTNRVFISSLDKEKLDEDSVPPSLLERTPTDVSQVWVTTRVAGSPTVNLRTGTGEGKFLSCDTHGLVSADRDARGPQEEWTPVVLPDGMVAFMNVYEKYLSIDEVAGGAMQLRGDSEEVGFRERFWVKIQSKYKKEAHEEVKKREGVTDKPKIDEEAANRTYQTWGAGRIVLSTADKKEVHMFSILPAAHLCHVQLKSARKDGRLAEALLERRAKLKSILRAISLLFTAGAIA